MASKYVACLADPFDPAAEGAQVPDMYAFPTTTAMLRQSFTIQTIDTSGNVDFVMQPNPIATLASTSVNNGGQSCITGGNLWTATTTNAAAAGAAGHGFNEFGLCTQTVLANTFARYRVVGFGVRFQSILPSLTQQGNIFTAKVPAMNQWANYNIGTAAATAATWAQYLNFYQLPPIDSSSYITTQISQLQTFHENSVPNMTLDGGLEVVGQICSPVAFEWRDASNVTLIDATENQAVNTFTTAGVFVKNTDADFIRQGGWSALVFRATGLPNTTNTKCFNLDVVMHLEGVPNLGNSVISGGEVPPVAMHVMAAAIHHASKLPAFRKIARGFRHAVHAIDNVSSQMGGRDMKSMLSSAAISMIAM